jgi:hypothetical protein
MKRLAAILALVLTATVAATSPATPRTHRHIDWGLSTWVAGVQMTTSFESAADPYLHARFKRVGGEGQRQVRMGERHKRPGTHQWGPYTYTKAVKLQVGQKVVFTTEAALPCEPAKAPVGITLDMRIKKPGKAWGQWETWISEDHRLLSCDERR